MDEFDENSDEEVDMTGDENETERQKRTEDVTQDELGRSTDFLLALLSYNYTMQFIGYDSIQSR